LRKTIRRMSLSPNDNIRGNPWIFLPG